MVIMGAMAVTVVMQVKAKAHMVEMEVKEEIQVKMVVMEEMVERGGKGEVVKTPPAVKVVMEVMANDS